MTKSHLPVKTVSFTVRIDPEVFVQMSSAAASQRISVSAWLRIAAEEKLERQQKEQMRDK